jgi:hypothetical protein
MFRLAVVIGIPMVLGLVGGPAMLAWGTPQSEAGDYAMAALMGGALGVLAAVPNLLGALIVNKIGLRRRVINTVLFAVVSIACFGFLIDWFDTMLRVVSGVTLLVERTLPWLFFLINLILCCVVHRRREFLPKKVRTVS